MKWQLRQFVALRHLIDTMLLLLDLILQRDFVNAVKLLDLYEIKNRYVCSQSLQRFGLFERNLAIFCEKTDRT